VTIQHYRRNQRDIERNELLKATKLVIDIGEGRMLPIQAEDLAE